MLNDKKIAQLKKRFEGYLRDEIIVTGCKPDFMEFFLENHQMYFDQAKATYVLSTRPDISKQIGFMKFYSPMPLINSCYYAMFNIVRALLESEGIKIKTKIGIHSVTFDALVHLFYLNNKLEKRLIEHFAQARAEHSELSGGEKAKELVNDFMYEKVKRGRFNYEMSDKRIVAIAKTSYDRCLEFCNTIKAIIKK